MHIIRLRGPWQLEPLERFVLHNDGRVERVTDGLPLSATVKMPADWSATFGADFRGRVRYRRTFQKPTGLGEAQRVWLVVEPPLSSGIVTMAGETLGRVQHGYPPGRFDITDHLQSHSTLEIVVTHPLLDAAASANDDDTTSLPGGLVGEVRLEIEE